MLWPERSYPWGTSEAFNPQHSDLLHLRLLLLKEACDELSVAKRARSASPWILTICIKGLWPLWRVSPMSEICFPPVCTGVLNLTIVHPPVLLLPASNQLLLPSTCMCLGCIGGKSAAVVAGTRYGAGRH